MKYLRATATVDPDAAPTVMHVLANSPRIDEARKVNWNATRDGGETGLYVVDGDTEFFRDRAAATPSVESVALSANERGLTYALVEMRPPEASTTELTNRACSRPEFVVQRPIVYRDGKIYGYAVGDPEHLQAALDGVEGVLDVRVDEIGTVRGDPAGPEPRLSERQREALAVALELGYYDRPRNATHADIADELGCAPATASEHLQKAEATVVRTAMDEFGPSV